MQLTITFLDKILIVLCLMSYATSMGIQIRNPKINVQFSDWIYNLITSTIGAAIAYAWVLNWINIGARIFIIILISLISYPTFKFIVSPEAQAEFAQGIGRAILNMLKGAFKGDNKDNQNFLDDENDRI